MQEKPKHTILIVDDEEGILKALRRLLINIDINVLTAKGGKEALSILENNNVSLIISDQRMPEITGVEFLEESRKISPDSVRILLTGYADINAVVKAINNGAIKYYFNKPWDDELLISRIKESLDLFDMKTENKRLNELTRQQNEQLNELNASLEKKVEAQMAKIKKQNRELSASFMDTIKAISSIVELRIKEVGSHSHRVAALVRKLLPDDKQALKMHQDIIVAAFLHDIGKIGYPDKIIEKKMDQYTHVDMEIVSRHPILGQSCISQVNGFEEIGRIIRHHHENYNGTGFPDNLKGEEIPYGSRLICIADAFDHHTYGRGYPNQKKLNEASAYLVRNSNSLFDPEIIKRFIGLDLIQEFNIEESSEVDVKKPSELEEGMVVAEDVTTNNGVFLLPRGMTLSHGMINRIRNVNKADTISRGIHVYKKSQKIIKGKNGKAVVQNNAG